jgi:hypothetical protein
MNEKMQKIIQSCSQRFDMTEDEALGRIVMSWLAGRQAYDRMTGDESDFSEFGVTGTDSEIFAKIGEIHDERIHRIIREGIEIRKEVEIDSFVVADYCEKHDMNALDILDRADMRVLAQAIRDDDKAKIDEVLTQG